MASGFTGDDGVNDTIQANLENELGRVQAVMRCTGSSVCRECDVPIPEQRRLAVPWSSLCVRCAAEEDKDLRWYMQLNRRGSKDSQLR